MKSTAAARACVVLFCLTLPGSTFAANIAWVTLHPGDDLPTINATLAGFTTAPDKGYTDLLSANGHTVTRVVTSGVPDASLLNIFDVVIIGRSVNSTHYEDDSETAAYNGITAPLIVMGGYQLRNTSLGFTTGSTMADTTGPIQLTIADTAHPIFNGVPLDGSNAMVNIYADQAQSPVAPNATQRGISVNIDPIALGGTVLATAAVTDPNTLITSQEMVIGYWAPGSSMANSPPDALGGHRLVFLSGSREASGSSSDTAGIFDLQADGGMMFLNAVNYMTTVPEPASAAGVAVATCLALRPRRRRGAACST